MSTPIIKCFDFGQSSGIPLSPSKKEDSLPPDSLILVDAFWVKNGMKIRFVPFQKFQKDNIKFKVIFILKNDDDTKFNKKEAIFELLFRSDDTIFSQSKPIIINGSDVILNKLKDASNQDVKYGEGKTYKDRVCYYYLIDNFSSDLSAIV